MLIYQYSDKDTSGRKIGWGGRREVKKLGGKIALCVEVGVTYWTVQKKQYKFAENLKLCKIPFILKSPTGQAEVYWSELILYLCAGRKHKYF